jgi:hypothetical protein
MIFRDFWFSGMVDAEKHFPCLLFPVVPQYGTIDAEKHTLCHVSGFLGIFQIFCRGVFTCRKGRDLMLWGMGGRGMFIRPRRVSPWFVS